MTPPPDRALVSTFQPPMSSHALLFPVLAASPLDTIIQFFTKGGWFMIPLLLCSLVALTLVLLRIFALRRENVLLAIVENEIERFQPGGSAVTVSGTAISLGIDGVLDVGGSKTSLVKGTNTGAPTVYQGHAVPTAAGLWSWRRGMIVMLVGLWGMD